MYFPAGITLILCTVYYLVQGTSSKKESSISTEEWIRRPTRTHQVLKRTHHHEVPAVVAMQSKFRLKQEQEEYYHPVK